MGESHLTTGSFTGRATPSLGKAGASRDPSALLVGGFNRLTGILDVVEAQIKKRLPDRIIEDVIALQREYRCLVWAVEAVQFQAFLFSELVRRSAILGVPVPARPVTPHTDKILRIESLQPHIKNGLIRLHPSQTTLIEQLRHFPKADHDDGRMRCTCSGSSPQAAPGKRADLSAYRAGHRPLMTITRAHQDG
ncbi:phage terminase large subunit [Dentiradicibacter hellwigii]|uniref:Phage terminase large subunit n=1 Tax=Dentiradicibacter hellwigii TaxID=3149053 RepID=A0ABV4UBU8_9RHOO